MSMLFPTSAQLKRHPYILVTVSCEITAHIQLGLYFVFLVFRYFSLSYAESSWVFFHFVLSSLSSWLVQAHIWLEYLFNSVYTCFQCPISAWANQAIGVPTYTHRLCYISLAILFFFFFFKRSPIQILTKPNLA